MLRLFCSAFAGTCTSRSARDLEEMLLERELPVDHTTISRWVERPAPELEKRSRPHLKATTDSWRVDETYLPLVGEPRRMVIKRQVLLVS